MLDLETLATFVRVIECGSFSAVAVDTNVTPSSVSKQVSRLEKDVGAKLINRSTHELCLTEGGKIFFERAKRILHDLDEAKESVHEVSEQLTGTLKVHLTPGIGHRVVLPLLIDFMKAQPAMRFDVTIEPEAVEVLGRGFDLSIRSGAPDDPRVASTSIACARLTGAFYRICATPGYFRRHGRPREPRELAGHNCLIYAREPSARTWWFRGPNGPYPVSVDGRFIANEWSAIHDAVLAGAGIARLLEPELTDAVQDGTLETLFADVVQSDRSVWAFFPRTRQLPRKLEAFLRYVNAALNADQERVKEPGAMPDRA